MRGLHDATGLSNAMQLHSSVGPHGSSSAVPSLVVFLLVCGLLAFVLWS